MSHPEILTALRRARDLTDRDFAQPLTLDSMALAAHLSKFHFARAFTKAYGETPRSRPSGPTASRPCFATIPGTGSASTSTSGMAAERTVDAYVAAMPDGQREIPEAALLKRLAAKDVSELGKAA